MRFRPIMMTTMAALMGTLPDRPRLRRGRGVAAAPRPGRRRRPAVLAALDALRHAGLLRLHGSAAAAAAAGPWAAARRDRCPAAGDRAGRARSRDGRLPPPGHLRTGTKVPSPPGNRHPPRPVVAESRCTSPSNLFAVSPPPSSIGWRPAAIPWSACLTITTGTSTGRSATTSTPSPPTRPSASSPRTGGIWRRCSGTRVSARPTASPGSRLILREIGELIVD